MAQTESTPQGWWPEAAVAALRQQGVVVPVPAQVAIAADVLPEAIAAGAVLHPQTRLLGSATRIDAGAQVGEAGPAAVIDSWVGAGAVLGRLGPVTLRQVTCGPGTVLGCGVAEQAVFLGKEVADPDFSTGYGFRVRKGSLYEEDANSAQHTDTKMTLLLPWVTLGSNLNWCDIAVSGGTGPGLGQFTEIGSGAIHFNFTPRGDKATASLLGSLCEGVFLDRPRLFVGGNSSVIGPAVLDFGAVAGAGARLAGNLGPGLQGPSAAAQPGRPEGDAFDMAVYGSVKRLWDSQVRIIGELAALEAWYAQVRARLAGDDADRGELYRRGAAIVTQNREERISQLGGLARRLEGSVRLLEARGSGDARSGQQRALIAAFARTEAGLRSADARSWPLPEALATALDEANGAEAAAAQAEGRAWRYTKVVQALPAAAREAGRAWMRQVANGVAPRALQARVPALRPLP